MLAKLTTRNQVTIPKAIIKPFKGIEHFEIETKNGCIVLRPVKLSKTDEVRDKLDALGITENDVEDAIAWSRT